MNRGQTERRWFSGEPILRQKRGDKLVVSNFPPCLASKWIWNCTLRSKIAFLFHNCLLPFNVFHENLRNSFQLRFRAESTKEYKTKGKKLNSVWNERKPLFCVPSSRKNNKKGKLVKLRDTHAKFFKEREKQQITFPDSASDTLIAQNRL